MVRPISREIPPMREVTLRGYFLKRREFYRDMLSIARNSLICGQGFLANSPTPLNHTISVLKIASLLSIRPNMSDIYENGAQVSGYFTFHDLNNCAQGALYIFNRIFSALNAYATARSGLTALVGRGAYSIPLFFNGATTVLGAFFSMKAMRNCNYFAEQIESKSNQEIIDWIKSESALTQDEKIAINSAAVRKAKAGDTQAFNDEVARLERIRLTKKTEWIREAIGTEALNFVQGEIDDSIVDITVEYIRREMGIRKVANMCALVGSALAFIALGCFMKGDDLKKYAFLCYAFTAAISLPGVRLHRKIYQLTKGVAAGTVSMTASET